jgi:hypothetical protein
MMQRSSHLAPMALICTQCCTSSVQNKMAEQRQSTPPACSATCARPGQSNTVSTQLSHSTQLNSATLTAPTRYLQVQSNTPSLLYTGHKQHPCGLNSPPLNESTTLSALDSSPDQHPD